MLSFDKTYKLAMEIGVHHTLSILRETSVGLFLGNDDYEVLLPNKYCPEEYEIDDELRVFVYLDYAERLIATNLEPKILLNQFALLQVTMVTEVGAFLDWGLEKNLLVPYREQRDRMVEGRWYVVKMLNDEKTDRLYATNKIDKQLQNEALTVEEGEEVQIIIYKKTDLGYSVIIDHLHSGLIYQNEIFKEIRIGDKMKGYVKRIREDNKLDISLQPIGFDNYKDAYTKSIVMKLLDNDGFLKLNDKSSPEDIYTNFGISKKAFKKSIGGLYKERKIEFVNDGIKLLD